MSDWWGWAYEGRAAGIYGDPGLCISPGGGFLVMDDSVNVCDFRAGLSAKEVAASARTFPSTAALQWLLINMQWKKKWLPQQLLSLVWRINLIAKAVSAGITWSTTCTMDRIWIWGWSDFDYFQSLRVFETNKKMPLIEYFYTYFKKCQPCQKIYVRALFFPKKEIITSIWFVLHFSVKRPEALSKVKLQ